MSLPPSAPREIRAFLPPPSPFDPPLERLISPQPEGETTRRNPLSVRRRILLALEMEAVRPFEDLAIESLGGAIGEGPAVADLEHADEFGAGQGGIVDDDRDLGVAIDLGRC